MLDTFRAGAMSINSRPLLSIFGSGRCKTLALALPVTLTDASLVLLCPSRATVQLGLKTRHFSQNATVLCVKMRQSAVVAKLHKAVG